MVTGVRLSDAQFSSLQTALAERYRLQRELGQGGFATVYLAEDLRHHRNVAIKVLRPDLAAALGPERFSREIEIAAKLNHPHILSLFDSGVADGLFYYVMPFIEGESLRDRLDREKQLPLEDALRLTREIAEALSYAHERGVIHRDVKPHNIMLSSGHALVGDFGVAHVDLGGNLTRTGSMLGTPAYLSPEQAAGSKGVDPRSDQYGLACLLYEMLAGRAPFVGEPESVVYQHMTQEPPSVRSIRPAVPEAIDSAIRRALSKTPADRFPTVAEFAASLKSALTPGAGTPVPPVESMPTPEPASAPTVSRGGRAAFGRYLWIAVALAVVAVVASAAWFMGRREQPSTGAGPVRLVVLPFENLGDPGDQYFADGITEEITSRLAMLQGLGVIARTSAVQYRNTDKSAREIAEELDVGYVLEGTVRWDHGEGGASRVRVTPQLIRGSDETHLWADRYDAVLEQVFDVQSDIAGKVTDALNVTLLSGEQEWLATKPTSDLGAYDDYLRALDLLASSRREEDLGQAVELLERAVESDPGFAEAYARLGVARLSLYWFSGREDQLVPARDAIDRALDLNPDLPQAHVALGWYHYWGHQDYERAIAAFEVARSRLPNDAELHNGLGAVYRRQGRWEESLDAFERAFAVNPRDYLTASEIAWLSVWLRRWTDAELYVHRMEQLAPESPTTWQMALGIQISGWGNVQKAREILLEHTTTETLPEALADVPIPAARILSSLAEPDILSQFPDDMQTNVLRGEILEARGDTASARKAYRRAIAQFDVKPGATPFQEAFQTGRFAVAQAALGHAAEGLAARERSLAILPIERDHFSGTIVRAIGMSVLMRTGHLDEALAEIEFLLSRPGPGTSNLLRLDPVYGPLRDDPRFQALIEKYAYASAAP